MGLVTLSVKVRAADLTHRALTPCLKIRSQQQRQGLYTWALPTEENGIQGGDTGHTRGMTGTYVVS